DRTMTPETPTRERSWLHWGLLVAGLYLTWFMALTLPLLATCFPTDFFKNGLKGVLEIYLSWQYLVIIGILALSQFLFLRVPVRIVTKRPVPRKSIWLPVIVSGFWFGLLVLGGAFALAEVMDQKVMTNFASCLLWAGGCALLSWVVWAVVFFLISRAKEPEELIRQQSRWLLRGSILELMIAVPSHIMARGRNECCAGFFTFFGITMGVSVMLLSFGPAVLLLYHARWRRLKLGKG
ncbi:MAG: hypothetical protein K8R87_05920, partial [Verrucomicrobia bacterium]|nr:hypothetical protein [Verrucomicrobiota bacterium]